MLLGYDVLSIKKRIFQSPGLQVKGNCSGITERNNQTSKQTFEVQVIR